MGRRFANRPPKLTPQGNVHIGFDIPPAVYEAIAFRCHLYGYSLKIYMEMLLREELPGVYEQADEESLRAIASKRRANREKS